MYILYISKIYVWLPEWSKGTDLRSVGDSLVGSNPTPYIYFINCKLRQIILDPEGAHSFNRIFFNYIRVKFSKF